MNFRPGAPLPIVLDHLEKATKAKLVVDYATLTAAGYSAEEPIGVSAKDTPMADVLDALCQPRDWGWHLPRDGVIELTTREAARSRTYVEIYDVRALVGESTPEEFTARVLDATTNLGWKDAGSRTAIAFDKPSGRLLVRQTSEGHLRLERLWQEWKQPAGADIAVPPGMRSPATASSGTNPPGSRPSPTGSRPTASPTATLPGPVGK
jgi:hypothetical protein